MTPTTQPPRHLGRPAVIEPGVRVQLRYRSPRASTDATQSVHAEVVFIDGDVWHLAEREMHTGERVNGYRVLRFDESTMELTSNTPARKGTLLGQVTSIWLWKLPDEDECTARRRFREGVVHRRFIREGVYVFHEALVDAL